ncbi:MAG: septum formation initiator family protein [Desulfovibrionales bacterium]|nr:septum formation initiator family protein [Desulfovibrionales bacterium]
MDSESGYPAYKELQNKMLRLNEKISEIDSQNMQMSSEIRVLKKNPEYIERLIKRELFYVSENETMYIFKQ